METDVNTFRIYLNHLCSVSEQGSYDYELQVHVDGFESSLCLLLHVIKLENI